MSDTEFALTEVQRRSCANAAQLIREAGWPDKATRLDNFLQQGKIVQYVSDSVAEAGHANKNKIGLPVLAAGAPALTAPGDVNAPVTRKHPTDLIRLATILLHEADHTLCHGDIEAYGEMISFGDALLKKMDELFEQPERGDATLAAGATRDWGRSGRDRYVDKEPPAPPPLPGAVPPPAPGEAPKGKIKVEISKVTLPVFGTYRLVDPEMAEFRSPSPVFDPEVGRETKRAPHTRRP